MGAFNTVRASVACPRCHAQVEVKVQFKYGDTWQYEYGLGDKLRWGGNDIGVPGQPAVVVDGCAEAPCPTCRFRREWSFYVFVEDDRISRVVPADGTFDFVVARETHLVLSRVPEIMNRDRYPDLFQFFAGCFHEDWVLEAATADQVIDNFIRSHSRDELARLADLIDAFATEDRDEQSLQRAMFEELGCYYLPEADGLSTRRWLQKVIGRLRLL